MIIWALVFFYLLLCGYILSRLFVKLAMKLAFFFDIMDHPDPRKVHAKPTPLLGGLGIVAGLMITVIVNFFLLMLASYLHLERAFPLLDAIFVHLPGMKSVGFTITGIFGCGLLLFFIGLYDDKYGLSARVKFYLQIVIALIIIYKFDIKITLFVPNTFFSYAITTLWIVGITNSFNLLDNMDGLSAGIALMSSIVFFVAALIAGQVFIAAYLIVFIGVLLGFLWYNFHPAKIFMGDAGSLFIGFNLAVLTIMGTYFIKGCSYLYPIFMPVLILGVPIYDTFSVMAIRIRNGESIFKPDKNHFSHRLLRLGMSHAGVALFLYLVTFCVAVNAILLPSLNEWGVLIIVLQSLCMISVIMLLEYYGKKKNGK